MPDLISARSVEDSSSSSPSLLDRLSTAQKALKVADANLWAASQSVDLASSAIDDHPGASEIVYRADTAVWAATQALQAAVESIDALREKEAVVCDQQDGRQRASVLVGSKRKRREGDDEEGEGGTSAGE